jgi:hypothetical protein
MTASREGPAQGHRAWPHAEAMAEMVRTARDAFLVAEEVPAHCWALLSWQATQEDPAADTRDRIRVLVNILGDLACLVDEWCDQIDVAVTSSRAAGERPVAEPPVAVAQRVNDAAAWLDRGARALLVGAAELKYLAAELTSEPKAPADP